MPNPLATPIRVFVLGDARIETPVGDIEPTGEIVFATALYLALEKRVISRRALEATMWPDASPTAASHRLRQTIFKLKALGLPIVQAGKLGIRLASNSVELDQERIMSGQDESLEPIPNLLLLPGYEPRFSTVFLDWLDDKKREMTAALTHWLLRVIAPQRSLGDWKKIERLSAHLLQIAPFNEEGTLLLAESCAMRGAKLEGIDILDRYLREVGSTSAELRLPATILKRRIAERMPQPPRPSASSTRLIGRSDSMACLGVLLAGVRAREGRACLVWGEAGIGKTRLLAEFSAFASLQGVSTVRVQCRPSDPFRPLSIFVDLVPVLRNMRGAIGVSPDTITYLDRLTTHGNHHSSSQVQADAEFVYARIQQSLFDLIDAVAEEAPLLIVIEDVQRLDDVSISLLGDLIPWSSDHRILFAFTSRDKDHDWIESLGTLVERVSLRPLDSVMSQELIVEAALRYGRDISDEYARWCVSVAEGNPYFLAELASHWIEAGESAAAPPSLTSIIQQRLSRLDAESLQLLQTCALLGRNSTLERIERVLGLEHHKLLAGMNNLGNAGMLVLESDDIAGEFVRRVVPRHELLSNAVEEGLLPPARSFLHMRIGTVLELETSNNRSAAVLWDAAKHWHLAGDPHRAFALAQSCTTHLMELGLCGAAAEAYEKSLSFCTSDTQRLRVLNDQAKAYFQASDWGQLIATTDKIESLQRLIEPLASIHSDVELMTLRAEWQRGDLTICLRRAMECLRSSDATNSHRVRAGILSLMLLDLNCDHETMKHTYETLTPLLNEADVDASYRFEAGMVFEGSCGNFNIALEHAQALVEKRRQSEGIAHLMRALTNAAVAARIAGAITRATEWLNEALAIAKAHRLPLATEVPMQILASIALDAGDPDAARGWYSELIALPESRYDASRRIVSDSIGLRLALHDGNVKLARELVHADLPELLSDPVAYRRTYGLALLVAVELVEDATLQVEAVSALETSHLVCRRCSGQAFATFVLVSALRRLGRPSRADQLLQEYLQVHRREPTPAPMYLLTLTASAVQLARAGDAEATFLRSWPAIAGTNGTS